MNKNFLDKDITYLNLETSIREILKENKIVKINDLWIKNRKFLKNLGLADNQIKGIIIKLELNGFDLNKKMTK